MHTYFICDSHISQVEMREDIMKKQYVSILAKMNKRNNDFAHTARKQSVETKQYLVVVFNGETFYLYLHLCCLRTDYQVVNKTISIFT